MLAKILRFAVDSLLYCCAPMKRRAFTLRPSVVVVLVAVVVVVVVVVVMVVVLVGVAAAAAAAAAAQPWKK